MPKFKKAILEAGRTYHSPDGELEVTPERLKHWAETFTAMDDAGLTVPISWGHSDDPEKSAPLEFNRKSRKRLPQDVIGFVDDVQVSDDGKRAEVTLDVRGKDNIAKVEDNLADISPVVFDSWKDGDDTEWKDCFTHVDLVQHPVDHRQTDFEPVEALACSLRLGLDTGKPQHYRLTTVAVEAADDTGNRETVVVTGGSKLKNILNLLAKMQVPIVLSEDTTPENLLDRLEQALLTADSISNEEETMADDSQLKVEAPDVVQLSLAQKKQLAFADNQHRETVGKRLEALRDTGRITPDEFKAREEGVKAIKLSLNDEGEHEPTSLEGWIASREEIPQGTFWTDEQKLRMSVDAVVAHPGELQTDHGPDGELTEEAAEDIVDEMFHAKKQTATA